MFFRQIFDPKLAQYAYLIGCQQTGEAIVIDPERDIDRYLEIATEEGLEIVAATETHIHADFLSGSRELATRVGARIFLSDEGGDDWRYAWPTSPTYDVTLLKDGDIFRVGKIEFRAVHTPGHTPEHLAFLVTDVGGGADQPMGVLSGDFVFVNDLGRPDLLESAAGQSGMMEPSARSLYDSVQEFLTLPDYLQIWPAHGAGSACGKALGAVPETTVGYERMFNPAIAVASRGKEAFVEAILEGQPEPPLYFARMKRENRDGPQVLGGLPQPRALSPAELIELSDRTDVVVVDTRRDRSAFMAGHLPASLHAPMDRTFNTVVGSYVEAGLPIYLITEEADLEAAVRDLIRIGLDDIVGFATPATLAEASSSLNMGTIAVVDFDRAIAMSERPGTRWLDVRRRAEFEAGHLPGAQCIPHTRLAARRTELEPDQTQLIYCRTGSRAATAAALLQRLGYSVAYVDDEIAQVSSRDLQTDVEVHTTATA